MYALLAIIAIAALLIWAAIIRHAGLFAGCLITLVAGVVLGYDFFHIGSITSDRLLVVLLLGTFLVVRTLGQTNTYRWTRTDIAFVALLFVLVLSTLLHDWRWRGNLPMARLLFYYLLPAALYWVARQTRTRQEILILAFAAVAVFGAYLSGTAVAETQEWYGFVFPKYIFTSSFTEFLGRGRGPLLNPVGNGILICVSMVSTLMLWPHVRKPGRVAIVLCVLLHLAGAYCTLTRSVWLAAAGCLGIVGLLSFPVRIRRLCIVATLLGGTIVLPVTYQKFKAFKRDKNVSVADMAGSASLRPIFAHVAWSMFKDNPLTGVGYGHYREHSSNYTQDRSTDLRLKLAMQYEQHNAWLSLLVETGIVGVSLFTAAFLGWLRAGWQLWKRLDAPLAARQVGLLQLTFCFTYFVNGMLHELSIIPMMNMAFFCLSGLTVGLWLHYVVPAAIQKPVRVLPGTLPIATPRLTA